MNSLRSIAVALSLIFHGTIGLVMWQSKDRTHFEALDAGSGDDVMLVEQGIAIEGLAKLGDAMETIETAELATVAPLPPPVGDVKPEYELRDALTSTDSKVEDDIVKTAEPPPPAIEPPRPAALDVLEQPNQAAIATAKSSSETNSGQFNLTSIAMYRGKIYDAVQRAKIAPRTKSKQAGTVKVTFKIGLRGEVLSREITMSSGSNVLDQAVIAAIDRAEFPPIPADVAVEPMVVSVPFQFITR
jgi:protein TonB